MITFKVGYSLVQEEQNEEATQKAVYKCPSCGGHAVIFMPRAIRGLGRLRRPQGEMGEECLHVAKRIQQPTGSSGSTIIASLCSTSVVFIRWFGPAARSNPLVGYSWVTHGNTQDGLLLGSRRRRQRSNAQRCCTHVLHAEGIW